MKLPPWKVGELAKQTRLTVRTLHHYDAIGLLRPSHRTAADHRLYGEADIARLQQIQSLRHLGFSLDEIREALDRRGLTRRQVLDLHLSRLREQIELQQTLYQRLSRIAAGLDASQEISVAELTQSIEEMKMQEKYFTPEQMAELQQRGREVGAERIREVEAEWPRLIGEVRAAMEKGIDPSDAGVYVLAQRWMGLVREFSGGNPGIEKSVATMYRSEPAAMQRSGLDPELFAYVRRAMEAAKKEG